MPLTSGFSRADQNRFLKMIKGLTRPVELDPQEVQELSLLFQVQRHVIENHINDYNEGKFDGNRISTVSKDAELGEVPSVLEEDIPD